MQIEIPDPVLDALRTALAPLIEHLIDERVEQRRPLLLSVSQVAEELACSRPSVYSLIRGGYLEGIRTGRTYRVATTTLHRYVEELAKPIYERNVVSATRSKGSRPTPATSVLAASRPPRSPRPRQPTLSKEEIANQRCTVAEFAQRWWGLQSARSLIARSGLGLSEETGEATFRYGDLIEWMQHNQQEF